MHHGLEHLGRRDHRLAALERLLDDPLLEQRDRRRPDLDTEVAARNHHGVRLGQHLVERLDRLRLLDLRDHLRVRAGLLDQLAQVANVGGGADEGERDEVGPQTECELEVVDVLPRQGRNRDRDAGKVDALVRADAPTDDDGAPRASVLDLLDA